MAHDININQTSIETCIWHIYRHLMIKYGSYEADYAIEPLKWYIRTGRASTDFLRALIKAKPFMVARKLYEGGSTDEVVARVKKYIGDDRND